MVAWRNPMSGAWGFAQDFGSSIPVGASISGEKRYHESTYEGITTDEGALVDDAQVRPPPEGDLGYYWRRHGLGASGLEATLVFFSCGSEDVNYLPTGLFDV
jgi:hypothetical protein